MIYIIRSNEYFSKTNDLHNQINVLSNYKIQG